MLEGLLKLSALVALLTASGSVTGIGAPAARATDGVPLAPASARELDRPVHRLRRNPRIRLSGVVLQRLVDLRADQLRPGLVGFQVAAIYYRVSIDPAGHYWREGDVRAAATVGDTVFHDGSDWHAFSGPFTFPTSAVRTEHCFSKFIYLPAADPRFGIGADLRIRLTFPRTRQRFERDVRVSEAHDDGSHATQAEINEISALGCTPFPVKPTDAQYGIVLPHFAVPLVLSPGSLSTGSSANR